MQVVLYYEKCAFLITYVFKPNRLPIGFGFDIQFRIQRVGKCTTIYLTTLLINTALCTNINYAVGFCTGKRMIIKLL